MHEVDYFIWGYQEHFFIAAQVYARQLFQELDARFNPDVFLVAYLETPDPKFKKQHQICVVPDNCKFQPDVFASVKATADGLIKNDPSRDLIHTLDIAQERADRRVVLNAYGNAFKQAVEHATSGYDQLKTFISFPVEVNGYLTMLVLQLQRDVWESYYSLNKSSAGEKLVQKFHVDRSFLESAVGAFLGEVVQELRKPNVGEYHEVFGQKESTLREAARSLFTCAAIAGGHNYGLHGRFEACEALSTLKYEGSEGIGAIVFARQDHPDLRVSLTFTDAVKLDDYGAVRKLLQMASGQTNLLCDSYQIYGMGRLASSYNPAREDAFVVRFTKQFSWELLHNDQPMMIVRFGKPGLRTPGFPDATVADSLDRVFAEITGEQSGNLRNLARIVSEQQHGAMLVIAKDAAGEAKRLARQATRVKPFALDEAMVPLVTAIDGSVLVDLDGTCHAIGVILDGLSSDKCTPARGARYNSAIRYVHNGTLRMAIVKSEDGMVDVVPTLRPRVRHSEVQASIDDMREIASQAETDVKEYYAAQKVIEAYRFYLTKDEADEVNKLLDQALEKFPDGAWKVMHDKFEPHPDMDGSYYKS